MEVQPCNSLQGRMTRLRKSRGELATRWGKLTEEEKTDFFKDAHALKGEALAEGMEAAVKLIKKKTSSVVAACSGDDCHCNVLCPHPC